MACYIRLKCYFLPDSSFLVNIWPKIETKYKAPAEIQIETPQGDSVDPTADPDAAAAATPTEEDPAQPAVEVGEDAPEPSVETLEGKEDHHLPEDIPDDHLAEGIDDAFGGSPQVTSRFISFYLVSSRFISFHLISSHFISFHLNHLRMMKKMINIIRKTVTTTRISTNKTKMTTIFISEKRNLLLLRNR